jgi:hypothetical protein
MDIPRIKAQCDQDQGQIVEMLWIFQDRVSPAAQLYLTNPGPGGFLVERQLRLQNENL